MVSAAKREFGVLSCGTAVSLYTVRNAEMSFSATDYGCQLTSILLPNGRGGHDDVLLGFSSLDSIVHRNQQRFGSLIGRYANRVANAAFALDGRTYQLDRNWNGHTLHGGFSGYDQVLWKAEETDGKEGKGVRFTRTSPDGEQGYPGNLRLEVSYLLNERNEVTLRYAAATDKATPVNLTNHAYFNLKGHGGGSVASHIAQVNSAKYLEVGAHLIPTGRILPVAGTAFDLTSPKPFGSGFGSPELEAMLGGYDVCYCFGEKAGKAADSGSLPVLALITEPDTKRTLTCRSNQPCMQLYTSNSVSGIPGKCSFVYEKFGGFCLETQQYTNAPNVGAFPSAVLKPGETYDAVTVYAFS